jgi:hypothetical protein
MRDRLLMLAVPSLLIVAVLSLAQPFLADLETVASSKQSDYVNVTGVEAIAAWISFSEVATGVGSTSTTVAARHPEVCKVWAEVSAGGVAVGELPARYCRLLGPGQRHIALYRRGWFTGRLTLTDLFLVQQQGDLSE